MILIQETRESSEVERRKPLVVFRLEQTDYRPYQILQVAGRLIEQLSAFDFFDINH